MIQPLVPIYPKIPRLARTVPEVAEVFGIGTRTVWALIHSGEIRVIRIGGRTLIPNAEIERLLDPDREAHEAHDAG